MKIYNTTDFSGVLTLFIQMIGQIYTYKWVALFILQYCSFLATFRWKACSTPCLGTIEQLKQIIAVNNWFVPYVMRLFDRHIFIKMYCGFEGRIYVGYNFTNVIQHCKYLNNVYYT